MNPKTSILIPAYNRAEVIRETLDSIVAQTFSDWECIVVDDGSADDTTKIASEYAQKDKRFQIYQRPQDRKPGGCAARNYAFEKASGDYIKWLDSDDTIFPKLLELEVKALAANPNPDLVYCGYTNNTNAEQKCLNPTLLDQPTTNGIHLLNLIGEKREYLLTGCYTMRRPLLQRTGLWNEEISINQDGEFLFRLLSHSNLVTPVNYVGFNYRLDNDNKITSNYNDLNKARKKLKSWMLIDAHIQIRKEKELLPYISGIKNFLYKYHMHQGQIELVAEFHSFFQEQIKQEQRKGIKLKLLRLIAKANVKNYL